MPTYTLRPNADVSRTGSWDRVGGATDAAVLSDVSVANYVSSPGSTQRYLAVAIANATGTIPANERIVAVTPYAILFDSRDGMTASATFPSKIGAAVAGYGFAYGATFVSEQAGTEYVTVKGPRFTTVPTRPDLYWTHAHLDNLQWGIDSKDQRLYYAGWVEVETVVDGTVTAVGPTGTTADRGPTISWTYGPVQSRQTRALVKVFSLAQYSIGGFDPATSPYTAVGNISGSASSWDPYILGVRGEPLPNATYRAYVWVQDSGDPDWIGPSYTTFIVSDPVRVPVLGSPADAATVTTSTPRLTGTLNPQVGGATVRAHLQVASNPTFDADLYSVQEPTSALRRSGGFGFTIPTASRLAQGTWYWRVRTYDSFGTTSTWSETRTFTVSHKPATSLWTPSLGKAVEYGTGNVTLGWTFTDPSASDTQSAKQVRVWDAAAPGAYLVDTGIVANADPFAVVTIGAGYKDADLRWQVRVADTDGVWSDWSFVNAFRAADAPVATITTPAAGSQVLTPTPTTTWTMTASGGRTQASWRVFITDTDTSTIVADSGWQDGTDTEWTPALPVVDLNVNYSVTVEILDDWGLGGSDANAFTATYELPATAAFTIDGSTYSDDAAVVLDWSNNIEDASFVEWRVYRRQVGAQAWELVRSLGSGVLTWTDYLAPSGVDNEYVVVQAVLRFGEVVETAYAVTTFVGTNDRYFLVCPDAPELNFKLWAVHGDSFEDEEDIATLNLIGRGRRVEHGTQYGVKGSLQASLSDRDDWSAREQRLAFDALKRSAETVYLRNPFGDVFEVGVMTSRKTRVSGMGLREHVTIELDYAEITA